MDRHDHDIDLMDYLYDELSPEDRARFESQVASDEELRAELDAFAATRALLQRAPAPPPAPQMLMVDLMREARSAVAPVEAAPSQFARWAALLMRPAVGAFALVLVLAVTGAYLHFSEPQSKSVAGPGGDNMARLTRDAPSRTTLALKDEPALDAPASELDEEVGLDEAPAMGEDRLAPERGRSVAGGASSSATAAGQLAGEAAPMSSDVTGELAAAKGGRGAESRTEKDRSLGAARKVAASRPSLRNARAEARVVRGDSGPATLVRTLDEKDRSSDGKLAKRVAGKWASTKIDAAPTGHTRRRGLVDGATALSRDSRSAVDEDNAVAIGVAQAAVPNHLADANMAQRAANPPGPGLMARREAERQARSPQKSKVAVAKEAPVQARRTASAREVAAKKAPALAPLDAPMRSLDASATQAAQTGSGKAPMDRLQAAEPARPEPKAAVATASKVSPAPVALEEGAQRDPADGRSDDVAVESAKAPTWDDGRLRPRVARVARGGSPVPSAPPQPAQVVYGGSRSTRSGRVGAVERPSVQFEAAPQRGRSVVGSAGQGPRAGLERAVAAEDGATLGTRPSGKLEGQKRSNGDFERAMAHYRSQRYNNAIKDFEGYLAKKGGVKGGAAEARLNLARSYAHEQRLRDAAGHYRLLLQQYPAYRYRGAVLVEAARLELRLGNLQAARGYLAEAAGAKGGGKAKALLIKVEQRIAARAKSRTGHTGASPEKTIPAKPTASRKRAARVKMPSKAGKRVDRLEAPESAAPQKAN